MTSRKGFTDEFLQELYGSVDMPVFDVTYRPDDMEEAVAEAVAEAVDYLEWEGAAAATEAYEQGQTTTMLAGVGALIGTIRGGAAK